MQRLNAKLVIEGANIPITEAAETYLHNKGILCIPDFIANAGGVVCAAMEYKGSTESAVFAAIKEKLRRNTQQVLEATKSKKLLPRQAAMELAAQRLQQAMSYRRWSIF